MSGSRRWPALLAIAAIAGGVGAPQGASGEPGAAASDGPHITVTELRGADGEPLVGRALQVDERGQVAVLLTRGAGQSRSTVIWRRGTVTPVEVPAGGDPSVPPVGQGLAATGMSDRSHVVGYRVFQHGDDPTPCCLPTLPFRWEDGQATALDGAFAAAFAVNERGQVLGWRVTQAPAPWGGDQVPEGPLTIEAVVWQPDGEVVAAPADAHVTTDVWDINNQGQALVDVDADGNEPTGGSIAPAIWQVGGGVTELGTLGGTNSWGAAINERGWVAGTSQTTDFSERAFLWRDGQLIDLGDLGGGSSAVGHRDRSVLPSFANPSDDDVVNERGHVVGTSTTATGEGPHAFLWRDGEMTDLGVPPGGALPFPEAINDHDQVVGSYFRPEDRTRHAFLWQDGQMIDLGALAGADASEATDINDQGQISGFVSTDEDGDGFHETSRPVVWTVRPGAGGAT